MKNDEYPDKLSWLRTVARFQNWILISDVQVVSDQFAQYPRTVRALYKQMEILATCDFHQGRESWRR